MKGRHTSVFVRKNKLIYYYVMRVDFWLGEFLY